ncbi:MAG TPA: PilZ domain-containing protein [Geobacteraceae bacterium]
MAEKRDIIRLRKRMSVRFGIDDPIRVAFTEDISPDGLFIKTTNICPPGSLIKVVLALTETTTVMMEGRVMWAKKVPPQMIHVVRKCGMGVRILRFVTGEEEYARTCAELSAR